MGTTQPRRRRRTRDSDADKDDQAKETPSKVSGASVAKRVREELAAITGLTAESVISLERNENDDGWTVTIEMLELSRIPETDDVLGSYEVTTDADGELEGYRRLARYPRSYQYERRGGA